MKHIKEFELFESDNDDILSNICDMGWEFYIKIIREIPPRNKVDEWFRDGIELEYKMWKNGDADDDPCNYLYNEADQIHDGAYLDDPELENIATEDNWSSYVDYIILKSMEILPDIANNELRMKGNFGEWQWIFNLDWFVPTPFIDSLYKTWKKGL
jgi:hypothetical protein